ncbi:hypothetical protein [Streptomyces reniochalinae]|uniref:hypothetical protein n=1 Tax=Streptomyces reniochalinae TaxID=2250578 RepID=UPI0015F02F12
MPTPHGSRGGVAFSADELRVLGGALATALKSAPAPEDARAYLRLAQAVDEAVREGSRLRSFLRADLARYRGALPGAAAGYLDQLEAALESGHRPTRDDLAALRGLCARRTGSDERARRSRLLRRAEALASAYVPQGRRPADEGPAAGGEDPAEETTTGGTHAERGPHVPPARSAPLALPAPHNPARPPRPSTAPRPTPGPTPGPAPGPATAPPGTASAPGAAALGNLPEADAATVPRDALVAGAAVAPGHVPLPGAATEPETASASGSGSTAKGGSASDSESAYFEVASGQDVRGDENAEREREGEPSPGPVNPGPAERPGSPEPAPPSRPVPTPAEVFPPRRRTPPAAPSPEREDQDGDRDQGEAGVRHARPARSADGRPRSIPA